MSEFLIDYNVILLIATAVFILFYYLSDRNKISLFLSRFSFFHYCFISIFRAYFDDILYLRTYNVNYKIVSAIIVFAAMIFIDYKRTIDADKSRIKIIASVLGIVMGIAILFCFKQVKIR